MQSQEKNKKINNKFLINSIAKKADYWYDKRRRKKGEQKQNRKEKRK